MIFSYLILSLLMARHSLKKHIPKYVAAEAIMIEKRKIITAILKSSSIAVDIKLLKFNGSSNFSLVLNALKRAATN